MPISEWGGTEAWPPTWWQVSCVSVSTRLVRLGLDPVKPPLPGHARGEISLKETESEDRWNDWWSGPALRGQKLEIGAASGAVERWGGSETVLSLVWPTLNWAPEIQVTGATSRASHLCPRPSSLLSCSALQLTQITPLLQGRDSRKLVSCVLHHKVPDCSLRTIWIILFFEWESQAACHLYDGVQRLEFGEI